MKKIDFKVLIISILIPNILGFIGEIIGNASKGFDNIIKPSFTPPSIVFPIAWTILYILMGISSYIIYKSEENNIKKESLKIYLLQLILNSSWTFFFFKLNYLITTFFPFMIYTPLASLPLTRMPERV